mmetsp:Transcript_28356/g.90944  ORF Transcript_28356/g.90944 Transcript_28356/m.90944 type:complete len:296 (+) Transcript_28356:738-1625(+)
MLCQSLLKRPLTGNAEGEKSASRWNVSNANDRLVRSNILCANRKRAAGRTLADRRLEVAAVVRPLKGGEVPRDPVTLLLFRARYGGRGVEAAAKGRPPTQRHLLAAEGRCRVRRIERPHCRLHTGRNAISARKELHERARNGVWRSRERPCRCHGGPGCIWVTPAHPRSLAEERRRAIGGGPARLQKGRLRRGGIPKYFDVVHDRRLHGFAQCTLHVMHQVIAQREGRYRRFWGGRGVIGTAGRKKVEVRIARARFLCARAVAMGIMSRGHVHVVSSARPVRPAVREEAVPEPLS